MKLLVFAYNAAAAPRPSFMVKLLLDATRGQCRVPENRWTAMHRMLPCSTRVFPKPSRTVVILFEGASFPHLLVLFEGVSLFRHGVTSFYYVPTPFIAVALYRDWLVMLLCRPFFKNIIDWEAAGSASGWKLAPRSVPAPTNYRLFKAVDLSIVLSSNYNMAATRRNFCPPPPRRQQRHSGSLPGFWRNYGRVARLAARIKVGAGETLSPRETVVDGADPETIKVLPAGEGLFAAMRAVAVVNRKFAARASGKWPHET